jgi:hypothetical protein
VKRFDKIALLLKKAKPSEALVQADDLRAYGSQEPTPTAVPSTTPKPLTDEQYRMKIEWEAYKQQNPLESDKLHGVPKDLRGLFSEEELGLSGGEYMRSKHVGPEGLRGLFSDEELGLIPKPYDWNAKSPKHKPSPPENKPSPPESKPSQKINTKGALQKGDKGEAVKSLQAKLLERGYFLSAPGPGSANGKFKGGTKNAVLYFQVLNEIHPPNGIADSRVLNKINSGNFIGPNDTKSPHPEAESLKYTERDVDAVARGLIVETSFRSNYREMANIMWIMVNRSKRWNMPLYKVIDPDTGGGKNWYGRLSKSNRRRWKNAHRRKDFEYIKQYVRKVLDGISFKNEIGNKAHFLHPGGMPKCDGAPGSSCGKGGKRVCVDTGKWGKRCLPKWNIDGNKNMAGKVNVQTIGRARFS